jgi:hypothetical protein
MTQPSLASIQDAPSASPQRSPAILHFCAARERSLEESSTQNFGEYRTKENANDAYRLTMPELSGY